jgi:hypothetical protein
MARTFKDITRDVVDRFIQNILFVDDNAYPSKDRQKANAFDASKISSVFAQKGKLCTVFAPSTEEDLKNCSSLFAKSDVVVLDWYLDLENERPIEDAEKDADSDEPRGIYTTKLINNIIEEAGNKKLKLIIVYTGETDLKGIAEELYSGITLKDKFEHVDCRIFSSNITILIRAKYIDDNQFKHNPELKNKIVKYENLPDFISEEFSNFVGGLLPNFALSAITAIRRNTSNMLGVFSKDIDPAFLGHYVSIPDCNDAISILPKIFGTAVANLIENSDIDFDSWIEAWINEKIKDCNTIINGKNIDINAEKLKCLLKSSADFEEKFNTSFSIQEKKEKVNQYTADLYKTETTKLFCSENADTSNYKWAKLVQHSNLFSSPKNHQLTTGTIIKSKDGNKFLICIQQRCDSVRISNEEERSFLFLPLQQKGKGEAVVVEENKHLIVDNKSYAIELHKFKPIETDVQILAKPQDDQYVFTDIENKQYIWVAELKDMFAQHIVSAYASQLSRVGIDNSEWIRLVGKTKQ